MTVTKFIWVFTFQLIFYRSEPESVLSFHCIWHTLPLLKPVFSFSSFFFFLNLKEKFLTIFKTDAQVYNLLMMKHCQSQNPNQANVFPVAQNHCFPGLQNLFFLYNQKRSKSIFTFSLLFDFQNTALESLIFLPLLVAIQRIIQFSKMKDSALCGSYKWLKGFRDRLMVLIVFLYWFLRWLYFIYVGKTWSCMWTVLRAN